MESVPPEEILEFAKIDKGDLCQVKCCRKRRLKGRRICAKCKQHLYRTRHPRRAAWHTLKCHAKARGVAFDLTQQEFNDICEATGYIEKRGNKPDDLHLDRIDPDKGYTFENIKVITCSQNCRKGSYERWVTLKDGRRFRLYQIGIGAAAEENEWLPFPDPQNELDFDESQTEETTINDTDEPF